MTQSGRQSKGVSYARDEQEAITYLTAHSNYELLNEDERRAALGVAQNHDKGGLEEAVKYVGQALLEEAKQARRDARNAQATALLHQMNHIFAGLALTILQAAASGYTALEPNVSVGGGPYSKEVIKQAMREWEEAWNDGLFPDNITNVHVFEAENKEALGKGNVGDTLAKRKWQADFISKWHGRTINVHVDLGK